VIKQLRKTETQYSIEKNLMIYIIYSN